MQSEKRLKIIPLLIFLITFSGFLAGQILFSNFKLIAGQSTLENSKASKLESLFKNLEIPIKNKAPIKLKDLGSKIVIVNFWASWCHPCLEEIPSLINLKKAFKPGEIEIIGINEDTEDQDSNAAKIISKYKINFDIAYDTDGKLANEFFVSNIPHTVVFYKGKVREVIQGQKDFSSIEFLEGLKKTIGGNI